MTLTLDVVANLLLLLFTNSPSVDTRKLHPDMGYLLTQYYWYDCLLVAQLGRSAASAHAIISAIKIIFSTRGSQEAFSPTKNKRREK
jgi:hypothetical protein